MEDLNKQILEKIKILENIISKKDKNKETEREIIELRKLLKKFVEEENNEEKSNKR